LLPSNTVAAAVGLVRRDWSQSAAEAGAVYAAFQFGYGAGVLVLLPLVDRIGARRVMTASAVLAAFAALGVPTFAHDLPTAFAFRFLGGVGLAGVYFPGLRLVALSASPARRGAWVGTYVGAFYLGSSLSLLFTALLLGIADWRASFFVVGTITVVAVPAVALGAATSRVAEWTGQTRVIDPIGVVDPQLRRTVLGYTGHSWEFYIARGWVPFFLTSALVTSGSLSLEHASAQAGTWSALIFALGIPGVVFGGWLSDRLGRAAAASILAAGSGTAGIIFGLLIAAPWPLLMLVGCIYGYCIGSDASIYSTMLIERAPPSRVGSAQAAQAFISSAVSGFGPVIAGSALDLGIGWLGLFGIASLGTFASATIVRPLRRLPTGPPET
jgi:MFS family permease